VLRRALVQTECEMFCVLHVTNTKGMCMQNRLAHRGLADKGLVSDPTRFSSARGVAR
jgi:hypothetical protein